MKRKAFSIIELLVVVAIIALLSAILFPVFAQAAQRKSNSFNLKRLSQASFHYSQDADGYFPICIDGPYRDLRNTRDGVLTSYGEKRSDLWPHLLLPYLKDRQLFVDPDRGDAIGIWGGPALASQDAGYDPFTNTYRNQSRFPMFGINYLFIAPMMIPASKISDGTPTNFMVGVPHSFDEAEDPDNTIFFTETNRGYVPFSGTDTIGTLDSQRGFFAVEGPGFWDLISVGTTFEVPVIFWNGTNCSGSWCGTDCDPLTPGVQTRDNYFFKPSSKLGNNVLMVDGNVKFMTPAQMCAGTDYLTASPEDGGTGYFGGGANITNKAEYLWNLDENFYGL